jgi:hypothetical protein
VRFPVLRILTVLAFLAAIYDLYLRFHQQYPEKDGHNARTEHHFP